MYSKVTYASAWKAINGFIESMVELLPSRNTPPFLTPPPAAVEPQPATVKATVAAAAITPVVHRSRRVLCAGIVGRSFTLRHLRSRATAAHSVPARRLAESSLAHPSTLCEIGRAHV